MNAVEGFPLEDFSGEVRLPCHGRLGSRGNIANGIFALQAVRAQISEAQKIATGGGSEQDVAEAKIELEVCLP